MAIYGPTAICMQSNTGTYHMVSPHPVILKGKTISDDNSIIEMVINTTFTVSL